MEENSNINNVYCYPLLSIDFYHKYLKMIEDISESRIPKLLIDYVTLELKKSIKKSLEGIQAIEIEVEKIPEEYKLPQYCVSCFSKNNLYQKEIYLSRNINIPGEVKHLSCKLLFCKNCISDFYCVEGTIIFHYKDTRHPSIFFSYEKIIFLNEKYGYLFAKENNILNAKFYKSIDYDWSDKIEKYQFKSDFYNEEELKK